MKNFWTNICAGCGGPSNKYTFGIGSDRERPSRATLPLSGKVELYDGAVYDFGPRVTRVEVCYACWKQWSRKHTFLRPLAKAQAPARKRALELRRKVRGLSIAEIAGAVGQTPQRVEAWLSESAASRRKRKTKSCAAS